MTWSVLLLLLTLPLAVEAETHRIQSVDYRDYQSLFFDPQFIRINPGDSILFSVNNFDHQPQSVFVPSGATPWRAESGQSMTVVFNYPGVYVFDCAYHNVMGMAGIVVVGEAHNSEEASRFFPEYRDKTFVINRARLNYLWEPGGPLFSGASRAD